jgi:hypothetical protein
MNRVFTAVQFLLILFITISVSSPSKADVVDSIATELVKSFSGKMRIAVQPLNSKAGRVSRGIAVFIEESLISAIQRQASGRGYVLVERGKLQEIMREQEEFHNTEEFSKLIKQAGANVMVSISVQRREPTLVSVSARAIGIVGKQAGQVISASRKYNMTVKPKVFVNVRGVFKSNGKKRKKYEPSLIAGLSTQEGLLMKLGAKDKSVDFIASATIDADLSDKVTEEARSNKSAAGVFGGLSRLGGAAGALGSVFSGVADANKDAGKYKVLNVTVSSQLKSTADDTVIVSELSATREFPIDSLGEVKPALNLLIKQLLKDSGAQLAAKSLGLPAPKRTVPKTVKKAKDDEDEDDSRVDF